MRTYRNRKPLELGALVRRLLIGKSPFQGRYHASEVTVGPAQKRHATLKESHRAIVII